MENKLIPSEDTLHHSDEYLVLMAKNISMTIRQTKMNICMVLI